MNSGDLYDRFRNEVVDEDKPYLWTPTNVWDYMNDAYVMFARLTDGIADITTSEVVEVPISLGQKRVDLHPKILRFMSAYKLSTGADIPVINGPDIPALLKDTQYLNLPRLLNSDQQGDVRYLVVGQQKDVGTLILTPAVDDTLMLSVYRLPLNPVIDETHPLDEIDDIHHLHLLDWMKHLAYKKQDAETLDRRASDDGRANFEAYCAKVKAEQQRYKHKTRSVAYGGL